MKGTRPQKRHNDIAQFDSRRDDITLQRLEQRLDDGYRMIDARLATGADIETLEEFWIELLHEYEALCDGLPIAA